MKKILQVLVLALLAGCAGDVGDSQIKSLIRIAHKARQSGNLEAATNFYNRVISITPDDYEAYLGMAEVYLDMKLLDASIEYIKKAEMKGADKSRVSYMRGKVFLIQGKIKEAEKEFLKHQTADSLNALGAVYDGQGRHTEAQKLYKRVIQMDANYIDAYNNMGLSLMLCKDYERAIFYLENACSLHDANVAFRSNLALAYGMSGNFAKAKEVYAQDFEGEELERKITDLEKSITK